MTFCLSLVAVKYCWTKMHFACNQICWLQLHLQSFTHTLCRFALGKLYKLRPDDILPVSCCGQVLLNPNAFWLLTWIANIDNLLSLLLSCPLSTPPPTSFKLFSAMWHYFVEKCIQYFKLFFSDHIVENFWNLGIHGHDKMWYIQ